MSNIIEIQIFFYAAFLPIFCPPFLIFLLEREAEIAVTVVWTKDEITWHREGAIMHLEKVKVEEQNSGKLCICVHVKVSVNFMQHF